MLDRLFFSCFLTAVMASFVLGCGSSPSHQDKLREITDDTSLTEEDKLKRLAEQIFNLSEFAIMPAEPPGHHVTLSIRCNDDEVVRKIMEGKAPANLQSALKEFHLKGLLLQLADYLIRVQDMHLQRLTVSLHSTDNGESDSHGMETRRYQLVLARAKFAEFLAVAKLRPQEGVPKAETIWKVEHDQFR